MLNASRPVSLFSLFSSLARSHSFFILFYFWLGSVWRSIWLCTVFPSHFIYLVTKIVFSNSPHTHANSDTYADYDTNGKDDNAPCANQTVASTSGERVNGRCCKNCARRMQLATNTANCSNARSSNTIPANPINNRNQSNSEENNNDEFDHLNGNGIVRMDMSKIIDSTGLPTYDAALKLESCGYV